MAAIQRHGRHSLKPNSPETVSYSFGFHSHVGAIIGVLEFGSVLKTIMVAGQFVDRRIRRYYNLEFETIAAVRSYQFYELELGLGGLAGMYPVMQMCRLMARHRSPSLSIMC